MLRRLGLHLAGGLDEGQQRQVDEAGLAARQILTQLANSLKKRQALNVAHRPANLHQDEINPLARIGENKLLYLVCDMGDDLNRSAQIVAAALSLQDGLIDLAGGDIIGAGCGDAGKPFVMAKIQIGLGPVVGDEDLPVLIGTHRPWIDIEIGIKLAQPNPVPASLKERPEGGGGETLSQGGDHASGDEYVPGHGRSN